MALDKNITELDQIPAYQDKDLIVIGRVTDGRLFQISIGEFKKNLPSTGKSAFREWLEAGNTGTEDDFVQFMQGKIPASQWNGTSIRFQKPDGSYGPYVNLKGIDGDGALTQLDAYEQLGYQPVLNLDYNYYQPNKKILLAGNLFLAITGTQDGDTGIIALIRSAAAQESITLNGRLTRNYTYPTDPTAVIFLQYTDVAGDLYWTCLNPLN